ncbi:type II secretion system protein [Candidatus Beckwithbacteria bacterium]|nr:type II secretion system protein [Candidatus Beckwithbacteria bacterium]
MFYKKQKAFTLIELLVTITIVVILSTVGLANYASVAKKGRDSRRQADLEQIRGALELYKADNGSYPEDLTLTCNDEFGYDSNSDNVNDIVYMKQIPCDPKNEDDYVYSYEREDAFNYNLKAKMEAEEGNCDNNFQNCSSDTEDIECDYYCLTNP